MRGAALLLLFLSGAASLAAEPVETPTPNCVVELEDQLLAPHYFRIVDDYRTPEYYEALEELQRMTEGLVERTLERLHNLPKDRRLTIPLTEARFAPMDDCIEAASMMHTELGMKVFDEGGYGVAEFHFDAAYELIRLISDGERHDRFFRNWLLALGYYLQRAMFLHDYEHASRSFVMARQYYDEAVRRFGDDGEVLLSAGTLYESSGSLASGEKKHLERRRSSTRAPSPRTRR